VGGPSPAAFIHGAHVKIRIRARSRVDGIVPGLAMVSLVVLLAACGAASGPTAPAASVAAIVTPPPSVAASPTAAATATATAKPTPEPLPTILERPTDIPTDGACEEGHACLGLIKAGVHHSQLFAPGFSFTMTEAGWENLAMTPGQLALLPLDAPGDAIAFFRQPKLTKTDGTLDFSVPLTVEGITGWFAAHPDLTVGPATAVTVGGLHGMRMTFMAAPTSTAHYPADCPVQTCVNLMQGRAPTWSWDWGTVSSERQRMDVLAAKDGVVLIFVDSLDGTTFDTLTKAADAILATVHFDKS
jgi:hypothetical protein